MFQDMIGAIEYDANSYDDESTNPRTIVNMLMNVFQQQQQAIFKHIKQMLTVKEIDFIKVGRNDFCPCGSGKNSKIVTVVNSFR